MGMEGVCTERGEKGKGRQQAEEPKNEEEGDTGKRGDRELLGRIQRKQEGLRRYSLHTRHEALGREERALHGHVGHHNGLDSSNQSSI